MTVANGGFHTAVYRSTHSSWLMTAIEPIRSQTIRIRFLIASQAAAPEYPEGHRQIYDALVRRNVHIAEAIVSDHVEEDLKVAVRHLSLLAGPPGVFYYDRSGLPNAPLIRRCPVRGRCAGDRPRNASIPDRAGCSRRLHASTVRPCHHGGTVHTPDGTITGSQIRIRDGKIVYR